jgi:lipoteichoic acid synthase
MTGLLPLRTEVTVGFAKNDSLVGFPDLLLKQGIVKHTQILVPTSPSLWEQNAMNNVYHIEKMYSKKDYSMNQTGDDLVDEEIFEFAKQLDAKMPSNSFSLILSLSMHEPFDEYVEHGFQFEDNSLPIRYKNYLITSHYFDEQIGKYIKHLKADGLYDKSIIVIASDHEPLLHNMDMEGKVSKELPLYIINGGFDKSKVWTGTCNQLDVYTTLLDIIGVKSKWRGLGHTLLDPNYSNSVTNKAWQLSEWIIYGDYFRKK